MSQSCSIKKCIRTSRGLCDCCQQNLCLQHLNEHNASLISQLNPLTDEINALGDRLKTLSIHKAIADSREKLEQWREDCYKKIDCFFEQKCQELDHLIDEKVGKQREELKRIQLKITELINTQETTRQDIDLLTSTIRELERNMNNIEEACFTVDTRPLLIDDTHVSIGRTTDHELDQSTLWSVCRTIASPKGSFASLSSNDRHLLKHQEPNLCLFDREMNIVKQTLWSYGTIHDMCWSSILDRFIVLGKNNIYLINENTMSIDNVQRIEGRNWGSCTCSDIVLFASIIERASSIMEFTLVPAIELIKEWKYPHTCTNDEFITDIVYNNGHLALIVMNKPEKSVLIDLRNAKTLSRIWTFQPDIRWVQNKIFRCCSLTCNEWLMVDYETGRLLQITKDGKIKKTIKYHPAPYRAILFGLNKLAASTMTDVRLHAIQ
ncbi:unnamed protein product [Rotaria sordida]|uniref:B box-type domain-containing protein n=2 Tax=Rotaria sordida TaxID=392033 RepID=A0A819FZ52_9BILA|nr:unnamed protein product [Rotaria sordida]CAF3873747.1 unnamed protein product [Rotaria sordida]